MNTTTATRSISRPDWRTAWLVFVALVILGGWIAVVTLALLYPAPAHTRITFPDPVIVEITEVSR
ncbi:MAG: hypothetical protein IT195_12510 [Microthrixaceae bacterium]|nr:hypothetical protein [Microthrixaceae bacterium]